MNEKSMFEVHRINNLDQIKASSLSLEEISKTYSEIIPIKSLDQFNMASSIAIVPPPGHMIVEKEKFKDLVNKTAVDLASKKSQNSVLKMEATIKKAQEELINEFNSTLNLIYQTIQSDQDIIKSELEKNYNSDSLEQQKLALDKAFLEQQKIYQKICDLIVTKRDFLSQFED